MLHYFAKHFRAAATGRRIEPVTCEKCGTHFFYELARVGIGSASAPYYLGQASASNRADAAAQRNLAKRLEREAELVPCPKCHWVNQDLIERYRRRRYRRAPVLAAILVVAAILTAPILGSVLNVPFGYKSLVPTVAMLTVLGVGLTSPVWVLLIRRRLRKRIDPNQTYPSRPRIPPATPPALVERRDRKTGKSYLEPVDSHADEATHERPWAVFRPGQLKFPRVCCLCLAGASTTYSSPFKVNENSELRVPLCGECSSRLRFKWWLVALVSAGIAVMSTALVAEIVPGIDHLGRWFLFGTMALFATVFGVAIVPSRVCRPYRLGVVDADRGIVRFAARNSGFTELLVEQVRASDARASSPISRCTECRGDDQDGR